MNVILHRERTADGRQRGEHRNATSHEGATIHYSTIHYSMT
jgi:hypothetical protein